MSDHHLVFLARSAVHAAELIPQWQAVLDHNCAENPDQWREWIAYQRLVIEDVERLLPDRDLCAAYQRMSGEEGDVAADTLLAEIRRRELDT